MSPFKLKSACTAAVLVILLFPFPGTGSGLKSGPVSEDEIQAAMVMKFTDFISWPEHSFAHKESPFILGILGEPGWGTLFSPFLGRLIQGRPLAVQTYDRISQISQPQILIISRSRQDLADQVIGLMKARPVLTIGNFPEFAGMGGLIAFYTKPGGRIGFKINLTAKTESGLEISSFLMKLGEIVQPETKRDTP